MFGFNQFQPSIFGINQPKDLYCGSFQPQNSLSSNNAFQNQFSTQSQMPFAALQASALCGARINKRRAPKARFSQADDELLKQIVGQLGTSNWDAVAAQMPGRTPRMCHDRWTNYLDPSICRRDWTPEEDTLLLAKHSEFGSRWVVISRFFPGRTDTQVKNRFMLLRRRIDSGFFFPDSVNSSNISSPTVSPTTATATVTPAPATSNGSNTQAVTAGEFITEAFQNSFDLHSQNNTLNNTNNDFPCDFDFNTFDDVDFSFDLF